jgi:hypothetical protein
MSNHTLPHLTLPPSSLFTKMIRGTNLLRKSAWRLPGSSNHNKWAFNTASKKIMDGVLDEPNKAEMYAKSFIGRENKMVRKRGFATQTGSALRLPNER